MKINGIEFECAWTLDCQQKQDFDFPIINVSTRYWPDHTAMPSIYIGDVLGGFELKPETYITGNSETECKYNTEQWIKAEVKKILTVLKAELYPDMGGEKK